MSLVVWLPLDGDLLNHGLSDINVTNNGATVNNNGKIGRCYYFNGSSQFLQFSKTLGNIYSGDFSWALWVKPSDDTRGILISEYSAAGASNVALEFYTNRKLRVYWNGSPDYYPNYTLPKDVWTHVAVTKTASSIKVYINGAFIEERTGSLSARPSTAAIRIGDDYRGGTSVSYMGYINDVRIYDHCLSAREVHEISKALFLHYKLDDNFSHECDIVEPDGSKWTHLVHQNNPGAGLFASGSNFANGVYVNDNLWFDAYPTIRRYNGFEFMVKQALTAGATETKYRWIQRKSPLTSTWEDCSAGMVTRVTTSGYTNGNQGGLYILNSNTHFCIANATKGNWFGAFGSWTAYNGGTPGYPNTTVTTGYMDLYMRTDVIYDNSGYHRNGTIVGTCSLSTDTEKYDKSMTFAAGNNHIVSPTLYTGGIQNSYTISWWSKSTAMNGKMAWGSYDGNRLNLYPSGTVFYWNTGDGSNNPIKNGSTNVTFASYQGAWHHYAMTGDGTIGKLYIDGSLAGTATTYKPLTATIIYVCGWDSTTSYVWTGNIADFRIYGTALSAEDIFELYHTPAYVDNLGDIMNYSMIEENIEPKIFKSGLLKANTFRETYAYLYLPAGSYVSTGLQYAAGNTCKAETVIKYATGGSGRDLMGFSVSAGAYWGVTAAGAWEPHGTFSYTNSNISVPNLITYQYTSGNESGTYQIGRLASSYTVRNKYIYNVKLYKNGVLQRDLYPIIEASKPGLFDILNGEFYPAVGDAAVGLEENDIVARIFKNHVEATQFIEI